MKKLTIILTILMLSACSSKPVRTSVKEKMLRDGKTWSITARTSCDDVNYDQEECKKKVLSVVEKQATLLCNDIPERTFDCSFKGKRGHADATCYSKCK